MLVPESLDSLERRAESGYERERAIACWGDLLEGGTVPVKPGAILCAFLIRKEQSREDTGV